MVKRGVNPHRRLFAAGKPRPSALIEARYIRCRGAGVFPDGGQIFLDDFKPGPLSSRRGPQPPDLRADPFRCCRLWGSCMGALAENMPGSRCGPVPVGWTSVKYIRHCFQRAATRSPPMKLKRLSRWPVSLSPKMTSVWSTPSIGRSVGMGPPMMRAKVGRKSMIENIA